MGVDRVHADIQLPSDVAGAFTPPDQLEYLQRTGFDCELGVDRKLLVESVWACAPWTAKVAVPKTQQRGRGTREHLDPQLGIHEQDGDVGRRQELDHVAMRDVELVQLRRQLSVDRDQL